MRAVEASYHWTFSNAAESLRASFLLAFRVKPPFGSLELPHLAWHTRHRNASP